MESDGPFNVKVSVLMKDWKDKKNNRRFRFNGILL